VRWRTAQNEQKPVGAQFGGGCAGVGQPRTRGRRTVWRWQATPQAQARGARAVVGRRRWRWRGSSAAQSAHFAATGHVDGHARLQPAVLAAPIPAQQFGSVDVQQQQQLWKFQLQQRQQTGR